MTLISVDPWSPGVDIDRCCCPGCGQTLRDVIDGGHGLPARHYRSPRADGRIATNTRAPDVCPQRQQDLVRLVFTEQRKPKEQAVTTTEPQPGQPQPVEPVPGDPQPDQPRPRPDPEPRPRREPDE